MFRENKTNELLSIVIILLLGFHATSTLFGDRFIPTHDGEYHIIRIHEFFTMLKSGYVFPRWSPGLNSGFGFPLFNFHYIFPNYVGSLFHFLNINLDSAFRLSMALGYISAAIFVYKWLRNLFPFLPALFGTIVSLYHPYWFVDMYVRGTVGEIWALTWLFCALFAYESNRRMLFVFSIALLILSHNILAMVFVPFIIFYMLIRKKMWIYQSILGVGLASYFWLPALLERKYVMGLNIVNYKDHYPEFFQLLIPSWGTGFSKQGVNFDEMSFQLGIITLVLIVFVVFSLRFEEKRDTKHLIIYLLILIFVLIFFMQSISLVLWEALPIIQYIQYPWRFLSLVIPICAVFGAFVASRFAKRRVLLLSLAIASFIVTWRYTKPVTYEARKDEYFLTRKEFTDGTSSIGNTLTTIWSSWKSTRSTQKFEVVQGSAKITAKNIRPLQYDLSINAITDSLIRVNTTYFPGWNVYINGHRTNTGVIDGVINFVVPRGTHVASIIFEETIVRKLGNLTSVISLLSVITLAILKRYAYNRNR